MSYISKLDLIITSPILVLSVGALLLLLADVFLKKDYRSIDIAAVFVLLALFFPVLLFKSSFAKGVTAFSGLLYGDTFTLFFMVLICVGALFSLMLGAGRLKAEGVNLSGEYYALFLMSSAGAIIFAAARELIVLFVGLEIMSMAVYCLCGSALERRRSSESALKYFLMGSFSSAFLLYGICLLYGLTGTTVIPEIHTALTAMTPNPMLFFAIGMILIGFAFKLGAVPFHFWAPDVYEGAPTPITGYMACVVKAAAVGATLRAVWGMFASPEFIPSGSEIYLWSGAVWVMAVLTMTLGNLAALRQRSIKRMLAYSSIAHAGYMLIGLLVPDFGGGAAILYYMVAYTVMTLGAFGVVMVVTSSCSAQKDGDDITRFNGVGLRRPVLGIMMAIFLFSLAGLPPGLAGLLGKFYLFNAAISSNQYIGLAIIAVINSAISCYYYLRVLVAMYFVEGESEVSDQPVGFSMAGALGVCAFLTVALGVYPSVLHQIASWAVYSL